MAHRLERGERRAGWAACSGGRAGRLLVPSLASSAQADPATLLRQYFEARNRGDVAATMAFYADDAVLEGPGLCSPNPCVGKAAIQREIERQAEARAQSTIIDSHVSGTTVTAQLEVRGRALQAAGVERVVNTVTAEVRGDKFIAFHVRFDANDPQTAQFIAWQEAAQQPAQLPRTGELPVPWAATVALGVLLLGVGTALRRSQQAG